MRRILNRNARMRKKLLSGYASSIGERRAVGVFLEEDKEGKSEGGFLVFTRPIIKEYLYNGKAITLAKSVRRKNQIVTYMNLSKRALCALRYLLNKLDPLKEWEDTE